MRCRPGLRPRLRPRPWWGSLLRSPDTLAVGEKRGGTRLTRSSEHLFTVGSTIATECWLAYHRLRSTGFNPFSVQQLASCCSYQAGPVSRIWCVCSSTGFPFHRGFSSSCARWCTGVFTTRRRYTYEISACLSRPLRVVLTSDRPQLRPSHSIDKDCDNRQAWIFCCRSCGLEQFIHYSERL